MSLPVHGSVNSMLLRMEDTLTATMGAMQHSGAALRTEVYEPIRDETLYSTEEDRIEYAATSDFELWLILETFWVNRFNAMFDFADTEAESPEIFAFITGSDQVAVKKSKLKVFLREADAEADPAIEASVMYYRVASDAEGILRNISTSIFYRLKLRPYLGAGSVES